MSEIKPWREHIEKHDAYIIMCNVLDELCEKEAIKKEVFERLRQAPSTDRNGDWTPCSERLPEEYDEYLCQCDDGEMLVVWLEDAEWCKKYIAKENIIAWKPLPEPYRKEKPNE